MPTICLGIRGATTVDANTKEAIVDATAELLLEMTHANGIAENDVAAIFFTTTRDVNAEFPAVAARVRLGWVQTALINSHEMDVPDATPSVVRVLILANTDRTKENLVHVYLKGASNLRSRGTER
jgi:chorismate mutase